MKKLFSWLCTAAMLMQLLVATPLPYTYAAGNTTIEAPTVTAHPGDKGVAVAITVSDNTGICGMLLRVVYDSELKLVNVQKGDALPSLTLADFAIPYLNPLNASWDGVSDDTTNGVVLKLMFDIPADAQYDVYPIQINYNYGDVYDGELNDLTPDVIQGAVVVEPAPVHVHRGGEATCKTQAVCSDCGEPYGDLNAANHKGATEIRDAVKAICTVNGYTGDTWCLDCGSKIRSGAVIAAAHLWSEWVIDDEGATRECFYCKATDGYKVEKVQAPLPEEKPENTVSVSASVIKTEEKVEVVLDETELTTELEKLVQESTPASGVITVDIAAFAPVLDEVEALNHVSIPTAAFDMLDKAAEETAVSALEVQLTDGAVKFADEALSTLAGASGGNVDVDLNKIEEDVETVLEEQLKDSPEKQTALEELKTETTILSAVSVTVVDAGTREKIHDFTGNAEQTKSNVTIAIDFDLGDYNPEGLRVYYLTEAGEREKYIPTYSNGKLFIEVPHLSTFIVGYAEEKPESPTIEISAQPVSGAYNANAAALPLTVCVSASAGELSYQWYENTVNSNVGGTPIVGANEESYTPRTDGEGTKYYYVVVTNANEYEAVSVTSDTVAITLYPRGDANHDGEADSSDAVAILRKLAGY